MNAPALHKPTVRIKAGAVLRWTAGLIFFIPNAFIVMIGTLFLSPKAIHPYLRWICRIIIRLAGMDLRVHGLEKIDAAKTYIYVFNHINTFDHFAIAAAILQCIRGVEHEKHFRWPVYGWLIHRIGQIPVPPRGSTAQAIQALDRAKQILVKGISIVIAPEGTRSITGELQAFKKGAFHLAVATQTPIIPMTLVGAYRFMKKGDWIVYPGQVDLFIEDPIDTVGLSSADIDALCGKARSAITLRLSHSN